MTDSDGKILDELTPIFLEMGKAIYICQSFEESLCFSLSLIADDTSSGESGAFQAAWDFHSTKTLGCLLIALRKKIDIPAELDCFLEKSIKKRNEIVHGYLTKNAMRLYDPKGRIEVEKEISDLKIEVKQGDVAVNKLIDMYLKKYGVSNASLKQNADNLWSYLNTEIPTSTH